MQAQNCASAAIPRRVVGDVGPRQTPSLDGTGGAPLRLLRTIQYPGRRSTISSVGQSCAKGRDCQMKRPDRDNLIGVARALFYLALVLALLWILG